MRSGVLVPAALAFAVLVVRNPEITLFLAFGGFSLLILADLGGPRPQRAAAYATTTVVGAGLIALGTLASWSPWTAAASMLVVAFCIQFAGVFGGYLAASQGALQLAFVLAAAVPAPASAIAPRLLGWATAGAIATLAATLLWPRRERIVLRRLAARACRALADLVGGGPLLDPASQTGHRATFEAAVGELRQAYVASGHRPAGPTRRDRALAELVSELDRARAVLAQSSHHRSDPPLEEDPLAMALVETLRGSAEGLEGGSPPDLQKLKQARLVHGQALERWAAGQLRGGAAPAGVLAGLDGDRQLRILSYLALAMAANVSIVVGSGSRVRWRHLPDVPRGGPAAVVGRLWTVVRSHLSADSSVLHNSLRAALGLGLAVLLSGLLHVQHAFWVVLGTLSVIRSSALATGRTTLQALAGTLAGFAVGAAFVVLVGDRALALWIALPPLVFLAGYTLAAVSFVVGQAAFTVLVIVLFNLLAPLGWTVGVVRVEDVALGAGIGLLVGLLLWPRGARAEFTRALGDLYTEIADLLRVSFAHLMHPDRHDPAGARERTEEARQRAAEAFDHLLNERASKRVPTETGAALLAAASHVLIVTDFLWLGERRRTEGGCGRGAEVIEEQSELLVAAWRRLAARLLGRPAGAPPEVSEEALHEAAIGCLRSWGGAEGMEASAAVLTVTAGEWIQQLAGLANDLRESVEQVAAASVVPWWR